MSKDLYSMVRKAGECNLSMNQIILMFDPKIKASLVQTEYQERSDLSQEIKIKMIKSIKNYDTETTPGFFEFINQ
jgi:hypothetical protein